MGSIKPAIYKLKGNIKKYDWGGVEFISNLFSYPNPGNEPMAEYWLGAHDLSSSRLITDRKEMSLKKFIEDDTDQVLGRTTSRRFGRLPYLLKVLDVRDMLSIQVHPAKHEAEVEFERENKLGIALNDPHRNYKDDNHKPELCVALGEFFTLHGFKPVDQLREMLTLVEELSPLLQIFESTGYDQLYKTVMEMPQESVNSLLGPLLERIIPLYQSNQLHKGQEHFWAARAALTFSSPKKIDRGLFSIYFFNLLQLQRGEGLYQDAGLPHAYLEGQNVEIMANSDNVLRGGLTNKHIDVKELMKHIRFEETVPNIIAPERINGKEELYRSAAPDFKLTRFDLDADEASSFDSVSGEILLAINGNAVVRSGSYELELSKGESVFVIAHEPISLKAVERATIFRATVPGHG